MWRAYGGAENVCLIFNTQPFVTPQTAYELTLSPVLYGGAAEFKREFEALIQRLENSASEISLLPPQKLYEAIVYFLNFGVLSVKHYGFHEEAEWRVIHQSPGFRPTPPPDEVKFGDKVETIYHVPIKNNPEGGIWGASLEEALDRIIVGPIANAGRVEEELIRELEAAGISRANDRVVHCGIPFRSM